MARTLGEILSSPLLYPVRLDPNSGRIHFIVMSRSGYQESSFLDNRSVRVAGDNYTARIVQLKQLTENWRFPAGPLDFILHGAFCCSTLLARYLELIPHCFVLKEPSLLAEISVLRPCPMSPQIDDDEFKRWQELLVLALKLLSRTYKPEDRVIIKAKDQCNLVADVLLHSHPQSRIIFLQASLRNFLLSVLKSPERRLWVRTRLEVFSRYVQMFPIAKPFHAQSLNDSEAAAYFWLLNSSICHSLAQQTNPQRFLCLGGEQVAEAPEQLLRLVLKFLDLAIDEEFLQHRIKHAAARTHAKDLSPRYDAATRQADLAAADEKFGTEANEGMVWARNAACGSQISPLLR